MRRRRQQGDEELVYLRGVQREVIDVIGVRASEPVVAAVRPPVLAGPEPVAVLPPRAPTIRLRCAYLALEWLLRWGPWLLAGLILLAMLRRRLRVSTSKACTPNISDLK